MLAKYYSLDECKKIDEVFNKLRELQEDGKIMFENVEEDIFKIRDCGLSPKELKDLILFFEKNDIIEYLDYDDPYNDEDEDIEDEFDDYDDDYDDDF